MAGPCVESWRQIIYYRPGRCWDHVSALRKLYISRRRKEKDGQSKNAANNRLMEIERLALNGCSMNWATSFLSLAVGCFALLCYLSFSLFPETCPSLLPRFTAMRHAGNGLDLADKLTSIERDNYGPFASANFFQLAARAVSSIMSRYQVNFQGFFSLRGGQTTEMLANLTPNKGLARSAFWMTTATK